jgi:hypothetical protein
VALTEETWFAPPFLDVVFLVVEEGLLILLRNVLRLTRRRPADSDAR